MKIATKTLVALLIVTVMTLSSNSFVSAMSDTARRSEHRLMKVTKKHDRKLELQAEILGISPEQLREELKTADFDQILKKYGFKDREAYRTAMIGKIKDELKKRGWSDEKMQRVVEKRMIRLYHKHI